MKHVIFSLGVFAMSTLSACPLPIVTVDDQNCSVLHQKTIDLQLEEMSLGQKIGQQLIASLEPHQPAAGLAAPQIGINRSVFIYSYNRDPKNLEVVINPTCSPVGEQTAEGWEGCLSVILSSNTWKLAKLARHETVHVSYTNGNGEFVEKDLSGFAAKVFQHEYDHLQGIVNICRQDAEIASFESLEALVAFMQDVKQKDAKRY